MDSRPDIGAAFDAFSVPAVVSRPDEVPITTRAIWITFTTPEVPFDGEFQRREIKRVLALRKSEVPTVPLETIIEAKELGTDAAAKNWIVDGYELGDDEHHRVTVNEEVVTGW